MPISSLSWRHAVSQALAGLCLSLSMSAWAASPDAASCPPQPEPPSRELMQAARQQATDRGYLWRLSRDGRDSYLYGTIHAGRPQWMALGPQTQASLFRTGALALELNLLEPGVREALMAMMQAPARPLPPALMKSLRVAWAAECLPEAQLERGAPEFHVTQLAVAQAQRQGLFALYGAESVLLMHSLGVQRPVVGLESVQTQLAALLARSDEEAAEMVQGSLAEVQGQKAAQTLSRLAAAWEAHDLQTLESYEQWCDCLHTAVERESYDRLVRGRNPGLAQAIERQHAQMSVFAAVGALHLVGPQGVPALLKARGFEVTRVF